MKNFEEVTQFEMATSQRQQSAGEVPQQKRKKKGDKQVKVRFEDEEDMNK